MPAPVPVPAPVPALRRAARRRFLARAGAGLACGMAGLGPAAAAAAAADTDAPIKLRALYNKDMSFSELARDLAGRRVAVEGFMAPPLKAETRFFVLTRRPMSVCPFCETEAEWPDDILAVLTKRIVRVVPYNVAITARGRLEIGPWRDPETGFLSRVRLTDASYG